MFHVPELAPTHPQLDSVTPVRFRFSASDHCYIALDTGEELPHITQMLDKAGFVDDLWFSEESSARGTCVHAMTASYDLGALDVASCVSVHRGYLLAHVAAMRILRPEILKVEIPAVHSVYRYGGRPDRIVRLFGVRGTLELKSIATLPTRSPIAHRVQTALQVILDAEEAGMAPKDLGRWCLYVTPDGRHRLLDHNRDRFDKGWDFNEARRIIRMCCGAVAANSALQEAEATALRDAEASRGVF